MAEIQQTECKSYRIGSFFQFNDMFNLFRIYSVKKFSNKQLGKVYHGIIGIWNKKDVFITSITFLNAGIFYFEVESFVSGNICDFKYNSKSDVRWIIRSE